MTIIKITEGEPSWKIINMWCGHKLMTALMSLLQKYKQPDSVAPGVIYFFLCWCEINLVVDEPRGGRSKWVFKSGQTKVVPRDEQPRSPSLVQQCANRKFIFSCLLNICMKQRITEIIATTHSSVISLHVSQRASATATARAWMAACASSAVTSPRAPTARPACLVITETRPTEANARVSSQCAQHGSPRN